MWTHIKCPNCVHYTHSRNSLAPEGKHPPSCHLTTSDLYISIHPHLTVTQLHPGFREATLCRPPSFHTATSTHALNTTSLVTAGSEIKKYQTKHCCYLAHQATPSTGHPSSFNTPFLYLASQEEEGKRALTRLRMFSCAGNTWLFSFQVFNYNQPCPIMGQTGNHLLSCLTESQHHWHIHADVSHQLLPRLPHCYPHLHGQSSYGY